MSDKASLRRLLILDDDADFRKLLLHYLQKIFAGVEIEEYDPVARGVPGEDFDWSRYDVLVLDYYLCIHNVTGLDILQANRKNRLFPAAIMLTGAGNEEVAVRAIKAGVYDYLRKENLDKEQLKRSILDAFEKHKTERQRLSELTNQSNAFNKAMFYQELEHEPEDEQEKDRVLLLIQLDGNEALEESAGIIMRDNIVRHMAKQSFDIFQLGQCNPHITRLSDDCVALLIDDPGSPKTLEFNVNGLCTHLKKHPYKFDERKFRFTVSVGVVPVPRTGRSAEVLIHRARHACEIASAYKGNSFHIHAPIDEQTDLVEMIAEVPSPPPAPESTLTLPEGPIVATVETGQAPAAAETPGEAPAAEGPPPPAEPAPSPLPAEPELPEPKAALPEYATAVYRPVGQETEEIIDLEPTVLPSPAPAAEPEVKPEAEPAPAPEAPALKKSAPPAPAPRPAAAPQPATAPAKKPKPRPAAAAAQAAPVPPAAPRPPTPATGVKRPAAAAAPSAPVATEPPRAATTTGAAPRAAAKDDAELDPNELEPAARKLKAAFDEKRVVQSFQPVIPLFNTEGADQREVYKVKLQLIDRDGSIMQEEQILELASAPAFRKFIDRWLLREIIGRLVNSTHEDYVFVLRISDASLADPSLFNWLRKLLAGLEHRQPGRNILLEVAAAEYIDQQKKAAALMDYLAKSHGFHFVLSGIADVNQAGMLAGSKRFDLLKIRHELLQQLRDAASAATPQGGPSLEKIVSGGTRIIVENVEDATTLTNVISAGAHYAMGNFIGEPIHQLGDQTNVESFEIS